MSNLSDLSQRREYLIARAELERIRLARIADDIQPYFNKADRALGILRQIKTHQVAVTGITTVLLFLMRKRLGSISRRAISLWALVRPIYALLSKRR